MKLSRHALWVLVGAALLYILVLPRTPIGHALDDALYILGAQSLLTGHYINLQLPWHPALTDPLPGFSLLISSGVAAVGPHWAFLKAIPLTLTLFSCVMLWFLLESWVSREIRAAVLTLFALNPVTVNFAGLVVSEPAFLFFVLFVFLQMETLTESGRAVPALGLGALMAWAAIMRPQGILLAVSVGIVLIWARRWRAFAFSVGLAVLLWVSLLVRNVLAAHEVTGYLSHWRATLPNLLNHPEALISNMLQVSRTLLQDNVLAWPASWVLGGAAAILAAAAVITGTYRFTAESSPERMTRWAVVLFTALYFAVQLFWAAVDIHYLYPITPFIFLFAIIGIQSLFSHHARKTVIFGMLFSAVILRYLYCDARLIPGVSQPALTLPRETYAWASVHLPPKSFLYTPAAPTVRLYTGCYAMYGHPMGDPDAFRYNLMIKGVTHVLEQPVDLLSFSVYGGSSMDSNDRWVRTRGWLASWPAAFKPMYQNPAEHTVLYEVTANPRFMSAYEAYRESFKAMEVGLAADARSRLKEALSRDPNIPSVLNAYGVSQLMAGEFADAESYFQRALKLRPDYPLALVNAARAEARQGKIQQARQRYQQAIELVRRTGEGTSLLPSIQKELQEL